MIELVLQPLANQTFTTQLDDSRYTIMLKETNGVMAATIERDDVTLISGARIVAKTPLLPYEYLQLGNFVIVTEDDAIPYYDQFGVTQFLLYVTPAEIEELRGT